MTSYKTFYLFALKYFGRVFPLAIFWLAAQLAYMTASAQTSENFGIAVVVNDEIVTHRDVENRTRLLFLEGGLDRTQANDERLRRLARLQLIDEALHAQEVSRVGIRGDRAALNNLIRELENNNNLPPGGLRELIEKNNIEFAHFEKQQSLRAAWRVLLRQRFEANGGVSEGEVQDYIARLEARQGEQEVRLREIFLPYPSPLLIAKTNALGQEVLQRIASGADFAAMAGSFSASHSARQGGDIGWVPVNSLADGIKNAVRSLQPGQVSGLIESINGATIIKLEERRSLGSADIAAASDVASVRAFLGTQKLQLLHRQILRRLKSNAFIELR